MSIESLELLPLTDDDARMAQESATLLARHLCGPGPFQLEIRAEHQRGDVLRVPTSAVQLLAAILTEMGQGNSVTLLPTHAELTTQQAADYLNVSRPFLIGLLGRGAIPYRKVGTHRRIGLRDLVEYRKSSDNEARQMLDDLAAEAQELGLGY